ncbi:MAG: SDR family oxidoreductase [Candidatus Burarchaeum sp.]|nr:SDR family oxidoreductase [Candidatus Burarchaeum sp.]MDO8340328.1 SDR family oxidoreductase [Candidatus Burarchaeum sp.]
MGRLDGKVVLITGASSGLGLAMASAFSREGAKVVMSARDAKKLEAAGRKVKGEKLLVAADVTKSGDAKRLFEKAVAQFGRIDIAIANAGYGVFGEVADFDEKDWDGVMAVNLKGVFLCCREAMRVMKKQKSGYIITISSTSGKQGYAEGGAYCASKFGVRGFSQSLAEEAKKFNVRVSVICPGAVDTHFFDKIGWGGERKNMLRPEDIAEVALFLATRPENVILPEVVVTHMKPVWED